MPVPGPCEFLVLHHVVTRPAVCVHLQGPLSACRHPWEQVSSSVYPLIVHPKHIRLQCAVNLVTSLMLLNMELRARWAQGSTELPVCLTPSCTLYFSLSTFLWQAACIYPGVQQECFSHIQAPETFALILAS